MFPGPSRGGRAQLTNITASLPKILSNRQESNLTSIKTSKYPGGTKTTEETMDALESHFKETFTKKADRPRLGDEWFNGVKKISRLHEGAPRETKNKDQPY
jgi:hypothetical protein